MAVWRRPVEQVPESLLVFRPGDWVRGPHSPIEARRRWLDARYDWARAHPTSRALGGDVIDLVFED